MRKLGLILVLAGIIAVVVFGCGKVEDKVVLRLSDPDGIVEPREVTVGYVNERMDKMPPMLLPGTSGDEGRREFLEEILRKELLVVAALRAGLDKDERVPAARAAFEEKKASDMLRYDVVTKPAEMTQQEIEEYYEVRDTQFQLQEIVVNDEEKANELYTRVTEGEQNFGRVAVEESEAASASDEGRMMSQPWQDLHPLMRVALQDLKKDDITEPIQIGNTFYILKITSRKQPAEREPLEGQFLRGITEEAQRFRERLIETETIGRWMDEANVVWSDEAMAVAMTRTDETVARELPPPSDEMTREEAMLASSAKIVPEFDEGEEAMELVSFRVGDVDYNWTLGDYAAMLDEVGGPETPKSGSRLLIETFLKRKIFDHITDHQIELRGFYGTPEMDEFVNLRIEEMLVNMVYDNEVQQKTEEPTGEEVKGQYRNNKEDYMESPKVDVRQIIVGTEAEANNLLQRLSEGTATFEELVERHSIDDWSKSRGGLVANYYQGESRLAYLQEPVFSMDVGEISGPVRAPGGYAILELLAKYPARQKTFDEVGVAIKNSLTTMRREERLKEYIEELKGTVDIEVIDGNVAHILDPAEARLQKEQQRVVMSG